MTSRKRSAAPLSEEPEDPGDDHHDDPPEDLGHSEGRSTDQDVDKRLEFEREYIERDLTEGRRIMLLESSRSNRSHCRFEGCIPTRMNGEPYIRSSYRINLWRTTRGYDALNLYYHVSCMEQIFPDLGALVERGALKMEGGLTQLTPFSWEESRFHEAVEDWFRYRGRTFDVEIYNRFNKEHREWESDFYTVWIGHGGKHHEGSIEDCERCEKVPDEPLRKDYFPDEPQSRLLSEVLASIIGSRQLDKIYGNAVVQPDKKRIRR